MLRKLIVGSALLAFSSLPAFAQGRAEVSGNVGWTFSDGVSFSGAIPVGGFLYSRADPKDSVSYSLTFGFYVNHQVEVEFLWNHQPTKLEATGGGGPTLTSASMNIDNYHGNIVYNFAPFHSRVTPFFYFGLGATQYGDAVFQNVAVQSNTRFSWAVGAGAKMYFSPHVGARVAMRWTPTYIKTDTTGWWCDPFFGCVPTGNTQYANQFEISGGITLRFGSEPEPEPVPVPEPVLAPEPFERF
jgi:opacity protein-like surface antigen